MITPWSSASSMIDFASLRWGSRRRNAAEAARRRCALCWRLSAISSSSLILREARVAASTPISMLRSHEARMSSRTWSLLASAGWPEVTKVSQAIRISRSRG